MEKKIEKQEDEFVIEAPEDFLVAFEQNTACKKACEKLVKSVVHEYELAVMAENELWRILHDGLKARGHDMDTVSYVYSLNHKEKKITRRPSYKEKAHEFLASMEGRDAVRKNLRERFADFLAGDKKKEKKK